MNKRPFVNELMRKYRIKEGHDVYPKERSLQEEINNSDINKYGFFQKKESIGTSYSLETISSFSKQQSVVSSFFKYSISKQSIALSLSKSSMVTEECQCCRCKIL